MRGASTPDPNRRRAVTSLGDRVLREGWAAKESRHWGSWRLRWLVLHHELDTGIPVLATYRSARPTWELGNEPKPTERLHLVGATCFRCPDDVSMASNRPHAFTVNIRGRDFVFANEAAKEMEAWVRSISMSLAELALRLGGVETGALSQPTSPSYAAFM